MNKLVKITIVIFICVTFLLSAVGTSSTKSIEKKDFSAQNNILSKTVTLYRHGIDGSITPVEVIVKFEEGQDLGEILTDKCKELFEHDNEIQNYLQNSVKNNSKLSLNINLGKLLVFSHGKGFHFKTKTSKVIFCRYSKDKNASTTIIPIIRTILKMNTTKIVEGNHSILVLNFKGFTTWDGRFSNSLFDILPRALCGVSGFVTVS